MASHDSRGALLAMTGQVRWWHVCLAAGVGLSMLTLVGWAAERWGGEGSGHQVQRIPTMARRPRRGGGGGGGGKWKKRKHGGRTKKTPEAKLARIRQEVGQVLAWMEKMERWVPGLPHLDEVARPTVTSVPDDKDSKEESEAVGAEQESISSRVSRLCSNRFEAGWSPSSTANDPKRQAVEAALVAFARDHVRQRMSFPRTLSSFERFTIYQTSELLGLTHRKVGDTIVVSKLKFEVPALGAQQPSSENADANPTVMVTPTDTTEAAEEPTEGEVPSVSLERCKILEECLTMALLDLDSLVNNEEAVPREERRGLVGACQQLLAALDAWRTHLQQTHGL